MPTVPPSSVELDQDQAVLMKPNEKKRSLASSLSLDNNNSYDIIINPSLTANNSNKRRKLNIDSSWKLKEIPELPFLYLKEKTSAIVLNENPQLIANRIVECAKTCSAYGQYNGEKAKASLTVNNLEFSIQLFKVNEKSNNCIIVEIQRMNGSSIEFHKVARMMLKAAKKIDASPSNNNNNSSSSSNKNRHNKKNQLKVQQQQHQHNQEEVFTCTFEMVDALLKKDRVDANLLGMESLQLLTSNKTTSDAMVSFASRVVVLGEEFCDIKDTIRSLIAKYTIDGETSPNNIVEEGYYQKMRVCALSILSNSLKNLLKDSSNHEKVNTKKRQIVCSDDWLGDHGLLALLLDELKQARTNPNEAYLAAKSLEMGLESSMEMRSHAADLGAHGILSESCAVGKEAFTSLESISAKILEFLGEKETK